MADQVLMPTSPAHDQPAAESREVDERRHVAPRRRRQGDRTRQVRGATAISPTRCSRHTCAAPGARGNCSRTTPTRRKAVKGVVEVEITGKSGKYHGHQVGYIVAESPLALRRGMKALKCRWKRGNGDDDDRGEPHRSAGAQKDEIKELLAGCAYVLEAVYSTVVQTHTSLETHGGGWWISRVMRPWSTRARRGPAARPMGWIRGLGLPQGKFKVVCGICGWGIREQAGRAGEGTFAGGEDRGPAQAVVLLLLRSARGASGHGEPAGRCGR